MGAGFSSLSGKREMCTEEQYGGEKAMDRVQRRALSQRVKSKSYRHRINLIKVHIRNLTREMCQEPQEELRKG